MKFKTPHADQLLAAQEAGIMCMIDVKIFFTFKRTNGSVIHLPDFM